MAAEESKQQEYDRRFSELDGIAHTHGEDSEEYREAAAGLLELAKELGVENDPGEVD